MKRLLGFISFLILSLSGLSAGDVLFTADVGVFQNKTEIPALDNGNYFGFTLGYGASYTKSDRSPFATFKVSYSSYSTFYDQTTVEEQYSSYDTAPSEYSVNTSGSETRKLFIQIPVTPANGYVGHALSLLGEAEQYKIVHRYTRTEPLSTSGITDANILFDMLQTSYERNIEENYVNFGIKYQYTKLVGMFKYFGFGVSYYQNTSKDYSVDENNVLITTDESMLKQYDSKVSVDMSYFYDSKYFYRTGKWMNPYFNLTLTGKDTGENEVVGRFGLIF